MYFDIKKLLNLILCIILVILLSSCSYINTQKNPNVISKSSFALSTVITIKLYGDYDASLIDQCFDLCSEYELIFSRTNSNSELYKLNLMRSMKVSDELLELLKIGLYYSELSEGAFDITIGKVTSMWDFSSETPYLPDEALLNDAVSHVSYKNISIEGNTVTLLDSETAIDLGAVAKGYIADKIKDFLLSNGVEHAVIDLGGNILCIGGKTQENAFTIGLQYPFKDTQASITAISIDDMSVVTSGIYERYFEIDNKLYHHIIDPSTGYPFQNNLVAVTIISEKSVMGDALSTVSFALGLDKSLAMINDMENVFAIFITDDLRLHFSDGVQEKFNISQ